RIEQKLDERAVKLAHEEEALTQKAERVSGLRAELEQLKEEEIKRLATIAGLSLDEARAELFNRIESFFALLSPDGYRNSIGRENRTW
ncbi:MAG: Ribonuclease Y, partial [Candidatus Daviesbacteria bacterium GW2011_GWA1_38_7]